MQPQPRHSALLHRAPWIAVTDSGARLGSAIAEMACFAGGEHVHLFVQLGWALESHLAGIVEHVAAAPACISLTVLAADASGCELLRERGIDAIVANHNAFLDERVMYPEPAAERCYDAVYVARFKPLKRHELARAVPRLALVSGDHDVGAADIAAVQALGLDVAWSNVDAAGRIAPLAPAAVRALIARAGCGLALSAVEGAMYASAEYLLCGRPLVSTPARGGREAFFDEACVEVVEPSADAVAAGVVAITARAPMPLEIRRRTLARMRPHRLRLVDRLSAIFDTDLAPLADSNGWLPLFRHRLRGLPTYA
ncbi:MAG: glycosyltransferase [Gammaproteobacteria bacterium]